MRHALVIAAVLVLITGPAFAAQTKTISLHAQHGSGENGKATLTQEGANLVVDIRVSMAPGMPPELAHIHTGTCVNLGSRTPHELEPVRNGRSHTTLKNISMSEFSSGTYSIAIHRTLAHVSTHVSCGGPL